MTYLLNSRQRAALNELRQNQDEYLPYWRFMRVSESTLNSLVELGLAESGPTNRRSGEVGWRITDNGWRCIYGKTFAEIMAPGALPPLPLDVWSWPPSRP